MIIKYELILFSVSANKINPILRSWKALKYLEIPQLKAMKKLDLKPLKNLEKVTVNANFTTMIKPLKNLEKVTLNEIKSLPHWLKVTQISFNPSEGQGYNTFSLQYASKLVIIFDQNEDTMTGVDLENIAKMKNLETLQIEWTW